MSCIKGVEGEIRFVKVFMIILEFCNFWNTESFVSLPVIRNYILFSYLYYQYLCTRFYYVFDINEIIYIALNFICFQTSDDSSSELNLFKMALREAYNRELEFYETQEAQIMKQIAALENDRSHLRERKRSHIQCLVNVIACYRKK